MSVCHNCGNSENKGGIYANGDPYGDRRKMGMQTFDGRFYCWDCADAYRSWSRPLEAEVDDYFKALGLCGFLEAWIGRCQNATPCAKHVAQRCWKCGAPATSNCSVAGSLVCGIPECWLHPHDPERHGPPVIFGGDARYPPPTPSIPPAGAAIDGFTPTSESTDPAPEPLAPAAPEDSRA